MIADYNITECIIEDEYENYYRKSIDWDRYYEAMAEKEDMEREDNCDE